MKNRIAITVATVTLLVAVAALGLTIAVSLNQADAEAESVTASRTTFVAVGDDLAPGQKPAESDDEEEEDDEKARKELSEKLRKRKPTVPQMDGVPRELQDEVLEDIVADRPKGKRRDPEERRRQHREAQAQREQWKSAVLQVVTNFDQADVTVNGMKYPEYYEPGQPEGMVLPAGGPYSVEVKFGENVKHYQLNLRPYETRLLFVDLTGFNSSAPPPRRAPKKKETKKEDKKDDDDKKKSPGKITVYSKPPGVIIVDGDKKGEKTPGSVELENGRHEVQVQYESGSMSEKKIVRVRTGSRIKLFFRERK